MMSTSSVDFTTKSVPINTPEVQAHPQSPALSTPPYLQSVNEPSDIVKVINGHVLKLDPANRNAGSGRRQRRCMLCVERLSSAGLQRQICWSNARKTSLFCATCVNHPPMCRDCFEQHAAI